MIAVIGENVVDMFPQADGSFVAKVGGSPLNVAVGVAKQGVASCYLSPISTDAFGDSIADYLQHVGVKLPADNRSSCPTSLAFVSFDQHQQPHYSLYRQGIADRDINTARLLEKLPSECQILHTGSLALEPADQAKLMPVLAQARSKGIWVSVDINVRLAFVSDVDAYRSYLEDIIQIADIIKASDEDLSSLFPDMPPAAALTYLQQLNPAALIAFTRGADGAQLYFAGQRIEQAGIPATPFVDTVGAGDTFFANLLVGLLPWQASGLPALAELTPVLRRAVMAATLNVQQVGCQPPTAAELTAALATR